MRNNRLNLRPALLFVLLILSTLSFSANAATWYVDQSNTGTEDGTTWATAFTTIQPAIDAAFADGGGDVWVAQGTYTETRVSPFHSPVVDTGSLIMRDGVNLYGGFAGNETMLSQQDPATNTTTIDGSTSRGGLPAFHVVLGAANILIDGFTITGGIGSSFLPRGSMSGAGVYSLSGPMTIRNSIFTDNHAPSRIGGALLSNQDLTIDSCEFIGNSALSGGGAVYNSGTCTILDSTFTSNQSPFGGAVVLVGTFAALTNCVFESNQTTSGAAAAVLSTNNGTISKCIFSQNSSTGSGQGGGALTLGNPIGFPFETYTIENCVFFENTSVVGGGALSIIGEDEEGAGFTTTCDIQASTFYGNTTSAGDGGAIYVDLGELTVTNSILSGNSGEEIKTITSPTATFVTYSIVEGGYVGTGNLDVDPAFVNVVTGDLRLLATSPAIDAGTLTGAPTDDLNGDPRPQGAGVDMGAYESNPANPLLSAASSSSSGGCLIASAAYGTPLAREIDVLRVARDRHLLTNAVGTAFVDAYYRMSPAVADRIASSAVLKGLTRVVLRPVLWGAQSGAAMVWMLFALGSVALLHRRRSKRLRS